MPLSDPAAGAAHSAANAATPAQHEGCINCAGDTLQRDRISTALWRGDDLVVIEDIPALVCRICGERYFEDEVAMAMDMMRAGRGAKGAPTRILPVPVYTFVPPVVPPTATTEEEAK